MRKLLFAAMAVVMALTMSSCMKSWTLFEDETLIEELPTTFEVKRSYIGKYESELDALLIRLGCTREDGPVYFNNGWNIGYLIQQNMAHLTYYTYNDGGTDQYLVVLNSTNKSGKTFQVYCEKDYDSQVDAGIALLDSEIEYMDGKKVSAYDAKILTLGGEVRNNFESKDDFVSQVKEYAESIPMWGISTNYGHYEATMVAYSQVNYGSSYSNTLCLTNKDVDVDFRSITNGLSNAFNIKNGRRIEIGQSANMIKPQF